MGMFKKLLPILIIFLLTFHFFAAGQAVSLRCTGVMPNGDAVILLESTP